MTPLIIATAILVTAWLSNMAEARQVAFRVSVYFWGVITSLVGLVGLALLSGAVLPSSAELPRVHLVVAFAVLGSSLLAGVLLMQPVRNALSHVLPLRPRSPVHLTSLMLACYLVGWTLANLYWVGGLQGMQQTAESVPIEYIALQAAGFVLVSVIGVGYSTRRSWRQVWDRLGLTRFPAYSWVAALASVIVLLGVNFVTSVIWVLLAPEQAESIGEISEILLGGYDSLGAAFLLSILSSVSEEILFRGAVQPVLGIIPTAVLFGIIHLQYAISPATLIVLLIGVVLGMLRRYFGTWTAVLAHFGYNFSLFVMSIVASRLVEMVG